MKCLTMKLEPQAEPEELIAPESSRRCLWCERLLPVSRMEPLSKKDPGERDVPSNVCRECWGVYEEERKLELPMWLEKWHRDREREVENDRLAETEGNQWPSSKKSQKRVIGSRVA